jgi:hypothetical protein
MKKKSKIKMEIDLNLKPKLVFCIILKLRSVRSSKISKSRLYFCALNRQRSKSFFLNNNKKLF